MDLTDTIAPTSDQLDAVDLLSGPRTFTIAEVSKGSAEQPVNIKLAEFPRPWRPSKGMRRVLVACWGPDASQYVGRRVTLFCDPDVRFGSDKVGGTRISHLSHIDKRKTVPMIVSRGKSAMYTVEPLKDAPAKRTGPTPEDVAACTDPEVLRSWWDKSNPALCDAITARVSELSAASEGSPQPEDAPGYDEVPPSDDDLFGGES